MLFRSELLAGYSDVNEGASVTIYDAAGAVVGTSRLGPGLTTLHIDAGGDAYKAQCTFPFSAEVPASDFFQVEVSHRGKVTVTAEEANSAALTLE